MVNHAKGCFDLKTPVEGLDGFFYHRLVCLADLFKCIKFNCNRFRGFDSVGDQNSQFPLTCVPSSVSTVKQRI